MGDAEGSDGSVDMNRGGFGKKISKVQDTMEEGNEELTLPDPVSDPVKAHINAL